MSGDVLDRWELEAQEALRTSLHKRSRDTRRVLRLIAVVRVYRDGFASISPLTMTNYADACLREAEALLSGSDLQGEEKG